MKMKYIFTIIIGIFLAGCKPSIEEFTPSNGSADFSSYVAIGDFNTAGFMDAELYRQGQQHSIPNILATQFATVGGGAFKQPLMLDELGFGGKKILGYKIDCNGDPSLAPIPAEGDPDPGNFDNIGADGPYNNMGVVAIKSYETLPLPPPYPSGIYSLFNPYYARFAAEPGVSTVIGEATAQNPSFFTIWLGLEDVLRYARLGGTDDSITNVLTFTAAMTTVVQSMVQQGAKGAVVNVSDITRMPYFTTISQKLPYNGFLLTAEQAAGLNAAYGDFEDYLASLGITWSYGFDFQEGPNAFVVEDEDIPLPPPFNVRQMAPEDLFLLTLPTDSILCFGMGVPDPDHPELGPNGIPGLYILKEAQLNEIQDAIDSYNVVISGLARTYDLALVDMYSFIQSAEAGLVYDGIKFNTGFVTGGLYSLDGIQFSERGNAVIANKIIDAINIKYNAQVPHAVVGSYPGFIFP